MTGKFTQDSADESNLRQTALALGKEEAT